MKLKVRQFMHWPRTRLRLTYKITVLFYISFSICVINSSHINFSKRRIAFVEDLAQFEEV